MFQLNKLVPAGKDRKRVGRGGNRGGTSGKGHKGQKARSGGYVRVGFEGGQMPLYRRLPKRGFNNSIFEKKVIAINVGQLDIFFQDGQTVDPHALITSGVFKLGRLGKGRAAIKILANGSLTKRLVVHAHSFSQAAREAIIKAGGTVEVIKEG